MKLQGHVAVVTGGAVRLGKTISLALAEAGCDVCVHYGHSAEDAAETVALIREKGVRGVAVQADLAEPSTAAETVFHTVSAEFGAASILVNNAAIFEAATLTTTTDDNWQRHLAINLTAPFCLSRAFAQQHIAGISGQIINIVDWRATRPETGYLAYTVAKSGLVALTKILALELAPAVQVNAIAPGAMLPAPGAKPDDFNRLADRIPLRRTGHPSDLADALLFLLRSEFLTGEVIHITGGQHL